MEGWPTKAGHRPIISEVKAAGAAVAAGRVPMLLWFLSEQACLKRVMGVVCAYLDAKWTQADDAIDSGRDGEAKATARSAADTRADY